METTGQKTLGRILGDVARLQGIQADRLMESLGLFRTQAIILMIVSHHEGLTHSELAEKLRISPAAISKIIKRLEEKNLLRRTPDPSDERISRVFLKEDGQIIIEQICNVFGQIEKIMLADISDNDKETLKNILLKIYSNLQEASQGFQADFPEQAGKCNKLTE